MYIYTLIYFLCFDIPPLRTSRSSSLGRLACLHVLPRLLQAFMLAAKTTTSVSALMWRTDGKSATHELYIHIDTYICICLGILIYAHVHIYMYLHMYMHTYVYMSICIYMRIHVYVGMYMYTCICIRIYMYEHMYVYIYN